MELEGWKLFAVAAAISVAGGGLFWLLARCVLLAAALLPMRAPFPDELLNTAGAEYRRAHRRAGQELAALLGALLVVLVVGLWTAVLLPRAEFPSLPAWLLGLAAVLAIALFGGAVYLAIRLSAVRRRSGFAWMSTAAVGNALERLNLGGNRVFHDVVVDGNLIHHVVVGPRGVFAVNVVARSAARGTDAQPAAELRNGKLWMAGNVEARPVGDVARAGTALASALARALGHRVAVRTVLAVPGWQTAPNGEGHHLVMNEKNLAMLTSWNPPEAHLMEEDALEVQAFLHGASRAHSPA